MCDRTLHYQHINSCQDLRAMMLYKALIAVDRFYLAQQSETRTRENFLSRHAPAKGQGIGYSNSSRNSSSGLPWGSQKVSQDIDSRNRTGDVQCISFFSWIAAILRMAPSEPALLYLLRLSLLGRLVKQLLRNDSISDCSERTDLYLNLLWMLEVIALDPTLAELLRCSNEDLENTKGLEWNLKRIADSKRSERKKEKSVEQKELTPKVSEEREPILLNLMNNLAKQAETFRKTTSTAFNFKEGPSASVDPNPIALCDKILSVHKLLQSKTVSKDQPETQAPVPQPDPPETYMAACSKLAYDELSPNSKYSFHFSRNGELRDSGTNPRRTIILAKELSTMATSLPPGIFVRSFPNRPDCIKALIAGPEDTPYYGGLFEFDIHASGEYPAKPPEVWFMTTARNHVGFNPNLYRWSFEVTQLSVSTGKVCLSLIGTWSSSPEEQWQPNKSTLMQVLISIQSMIFCSNPIRNEPSYADVKGRKSDKYNKEVRLQTVRVAICDWMSPYCQQSPWKVRPF